MRVGGSVRTPSWEPFIASGSVFLTMMSCGDGYGTDCESYGIYKIHR